MLSTPLQCCPYCYGRTKAYLSHNKAHCYFCWLADRLSQTVGIASLDSPLSHPSAFGHLQDNLAPVVQTLDSAIHWKNHYPLDNSIDFASVYPLDSDLSSGQCYPSFEQLGPERHLTVARPVPIPKYGQIRIKSRLFGTSVATNRT